MRSPPMWESSATGSPWRGRATAASPHSIGFALSEDYDGTDRAKNMAYCGIPSCEVIPDDITLEFLETNPRPNGPHRIQRLR